MDWSFLGEGTKIEKWSAKLAVLLTCNKYAYNSCTFTLQIFLSAPVKTLCFGNVRESLHFE